MQHRSAVQAPLSPAQWQQLEARVCAWERGARAALEATCGRYTRDEQLLPYLKLRPRGIHPLRSMQHASVALSAAAAAPRSLRAGSGRPGGLGGHAASPRCAQHAEHGVAAAAGAPAGCGAGGEAAGAAGCSGDMGRVKLRVVGSVRVFMVVQEAVGRLPGRVWLRLDAGALSVGGLDSQRVHSR